jgi:hypothetical protein
MDQDRKLVFLSLDADHLRFSLEWLKENIINRYLKD